MMMRKLALFMFMLLTVASVGSSYAQNGNAVVSRVDIEDLGNGTGMIVVKISGNQASEYTGGTFTISGDRIAGGSAGGGIGDQSRVIVQAPVPGNGNSNGNQQVLLAAIFPIGSNDGSDEVVMQFTFRGRIGNGLDWTYFRVGRLPRRTDI
jgi:hypothetical protein